MRQEIAGYLQMIIGAAGIVVTLLTAPALLDAIGQMSGPGSLPDEFTGASGAVRIFSVFFVLFCFCLLVILGLSVTVSTLAKSMGANHPFLTALFTVLAIVTLSITTSFAIMGIRFWVPAFVASLSFMWLIFAAATDDDELGNVKGITILGSALFLITGLGALATMVERVDRKMPNQSEGLNLETPAKGVERGKD
jgi:hypothetical protein